MNYANLEIPGLSRQDKLVVLNNPDKTIEELMELGLTQAGEKKLRGLTDKIKKFTPAPAKPVSVQRNVSMPQPNSGAVSVHNRRTNRTVKVSPQVAKKLLGKMNSERGMGRDYGQNYSRG